MKQINSISLGLAFAGCFLGAGYVSGQELWQFFGAFGSNGIFGLALALAVMFTVVVIMLGLNRSTGFSDVDKLVVMWDIKAVRIAVTVLELLFLFGVCAIMAAGVGALLYQLFGLPVWVGSLALASVVAALSLFGFSGMVKAFSATVPLLCGVTLVFGIATVCNNGISFAAEETGNNPLMGSWFIAALSFACYNLFGSIAMIAPLGQHLKSRSTALFGTLIGVAILLVIAGSVLCCVSSSPEYLSAELPMLALADSMGTVPGLIYGLLLLLAMFGTSLSSLVGFVNMLSLKSDRIKNNRVVFTVICAAAFFGGSLFGFGDLISVLYPIFGYCSSVFIVLMAIHYVRMKKNAKAEA